MCPDFLSSCFSCFPLVFSPYVLPPLVLASFISHLPSFFLVWLCSFLLSFPLMCPCFLSSPLRLWTLISFSLSVSCCLLSSRVISFCLLFSHFLSSFRLLPSSLLGSSPFFFSLPSLVSSHLIDSSSQLFLHVHFIFLSTLHPLLLVFVFYLLSDVLALLLLSSLISPPHLSHHYILSLPLLTHSDYH